MERDNKYEIKKDAKIAVLCGGMSNEREVSLRSGNNVLKALIELGYENSILLDVDKNISENLEKNNIEICYNTLHGKYGEDGCIQGLLEIMGIKYTGCNVKSSAICMDKVSTKNVLKENGLDVIKSACIKKGDDVQKAISELLYPLMVKPANEGSSIGMSKVSNTAELKRALEIAYKSDKKVLIEEYLQGYSITAGVLQDIRKNEIFATPVLGFETKTEWYDYEAKYTKGLTEFNLPAKITPKMTQEVKDLAIKAFLALECTGVARVDFLIFNDIPFVLEVNTNPGMTDLSDLPAQAKHMGISYSELVEIILHSALIEK